MNAEKQLKILNDVLDALRREKYEAELEFPGYLEMGFWDGRVIRLGIDRDHWAGEIYPSREEAALGSEAMITFTIHLPLDASPEDVVLAIEIVAGGLEQKG